MELTLDFDTDTYELVHTYTNGKGLSFSAAMNELVLRAQQSIKAESEAVIATVLSIRNDNLRT